MSGRDEPIPSSYREIWIGKASTTAQRYEISRSFLQAGRPALIVAGIGDRDAAEALTGLACYVERVRLEAARGPDALLYADVTGAEVLDANGRVLGRVHGIYDNGANPVAQVRELTGQQAVDIPLVGAYVDFKRTVPGCLVLQVPSLLFEELWYSCDATP